MVCKNCIRNIDIWHDHVKKAADAQFIINYIAKKAHDSSRNINEKQFSSSIVKNDGSSHKFQTPRSLDQKIMPLEYKKLTFSQNHKPLPNSCPLCINFNEKHLQYNTHQLCLKHKNSFTCLVPNCHYIFANLELFIRHYRKHLDLNINTYLCRQCFKVLESPRKTKQGHVHQDLSIFFVCCSIKFLTMSDFILHKIQNHSGKLIYNITQCTQLALDFTTPINTVSKNDTDFECNYCELFTCLKPNCDKVFNAKSTNYRHYIQHANIPEAFSTCSTCMYSCEEKNYTKHGIHKSPEVKCGYCNVDFESLHKLAEHRLFKHNSVILCSPSWLAGCPVCNVEFENGIDTIKHYQICLIKKNEEVVKLEPDVEINSLVNNIVSQKGNTKEDISSYICKICGHSCFSVYDYVEHAKINHKMCMMLKENGIKFCPICDQNFLNDSFSAHVEQCTNSMKIENMLKNCFKCIYCNIVFEDLAPSQFRAHLLYCKSFEEKVENDVKYYCCLNCTFKCKEYPVALNHANSSCIYFQLKMRYAMGPDEKLKAVERENLQQKVQAIMECKEDFPSINGKLKCKNCPQKFGSYKEAVEHSKRCSTTYLSSIQKSKSKPCFFFCTHCNTRFFNQTLYQNHILRHKEITPDEILKRWQCGTCWTSFESEVELNSHFKIHELQAGVPTAVPIKPETDSLIKVEDMQDCDMVSNCLEQDVILDEVVRSNINSVILDNFNDQKNEPMDDIEDKPDIGHLLMGSMHGVI